MSRPAELQSRVLEREAGLIAMAANPDKVRAERGVAKAGPRCAPMPHCPPSLTFDSLSLGLATTLQAKPRQTNTHCPTPPQESKKLAKNKAATTPFTKATTQAPSLLHHCKNTSIQ